MNKNLSQAIKAVLLCVCFAFFQNKMQAQTFDNGIFFQALARDNYSNPAKDRKIYVQSTIIQSTINGTKVLVEEFQTTTDASGVFGISIGKGARTGGSFSNLNNIDWSSGPYFLNLQISITPIAPLSSWNYAKDWIDLGTTSFGTVPYALHAKTVVGFDAKLNASDTAKMLLPYAKTQALKLVETSVVTKLNTSDTANMLLVYAKTQTVNNKLNTKDSISSYVTPTQLSAVKFDTTTLSNRFNLKANASDVIANTASIITNTVAIATEVSTARAAEQALTTSVNSNTASITANTVAIATEVITARAAEQTLTTRISANTVSITALSTVAKTGDYNDLSNKPTLSLPAATANTLGGVIVGNNLTIDQNGVLSASASGGGSGVPYTGATGAVNLGAYDLTVNGLTIGTGAGTGTNTSYNTAVGYNTLISNTTGSYNSAFGRGALRYNSTGNYNTASGLQALNSNTTGNNNTSFGARAGFTNNSGNDNTAIGYNALVVNGTGSQNTTIGSGADVGNMALSNATAIGYGAIATTSNTMQLGNAYVTNVKTSGTITAGAITYPNTGGTNGQVLTTSGSVASWATPSSITVGTISNTSNSNGAMITSGVLNLTPADASNGGIVTTGTQSFAGNKTLSGNLIVNTLSNPAIKDVDNFVGIIGTIGATQWESFVAGQSGILTKITLSGNGSVGARNGTLIIFSGTGISGTQLSSQSVALPPSSGNYDLVLTSSVYLTAGQTYTFEVIDPLGFPNGNAGFGGAVRIAGTSYYSNAYGLNPSYNSSSWGLQFQTWISTTSGGGVTSTGTITAGTVTYPNVHGTSGQVLSTTGSGTLTWTTPSSSGSGTHTIGESYGGGIVFYTWDNGVHGLIVATNEIGSGGPQNFSPSSGIKWGSNTSTGSYRFGIGGGFQNTDVIIAINGASGTQYFDYAQGTNGLYAAFIAQQYSTFTQGNVAYSSFGDWYLPSIGELNLFYQNKSLLTGTGYNSSHTYWSSTEVNGSYAYQLSVGGGQNWDAKTSLFYVLPMRRF